MEHNILELQIVCRTSYATKWCYLGIDVESGDLLRPIPSLGLWNEAEFFWPQDDAFNWKIGATYKFYVIRRNPDRVQFPHRNDDVLVIYASQTSDATPESIEAMHNILRNKSKPSLQEALSIPIGVIKKCGNGREYVEEGTECHSCGIVEKVTSLPERSTHHDIVVLGRPFSGGGKIDPRGCFQIDVGKVPS